VSTGGHLVNVFPIESGAFGFSSTWFEEYVPKLMHPAYLLMTLLLIISIGIMLLKRFEGHSLEKKLWNLPVIITILAMWPVLVLGLKRLIDSFNTFLVNDIFRIPWDGFGFPHMTSMGNIFGWTGKAIAALLPNIAYWLVYTFYLIFFFFFAVLGPFVLAKGILFDEIDAFLDLVKEITILFLWQTTLVIMVGFILPDIVSGKPFTTLVSPNTYFLSFILGIMILFVPSVTRKFGNHLGSSFLPPGLAGGAILAGVATVLKGFTAAGIAVDVDKWKRRSHHVLTGIEFKKRYKHQQEVLQLKSKSSDLEDKLGEFQQDQKEEKREHTKLVRNNTRMGDIRTPKKDAYIRLAARAKRELEDTNDQVET
jgi:hypothetical protein